MFRLLSFCVALVFVSGPQQSAPTVDFSSLDAVVRKELQDTNTPGAAIAVIHGDRIILARGVGVANVETGDPVRPDMLFRLGSTTKMITAAAVVLLAEQGKLKLDAPIGGYIPGLAPKLAALTANQLLSHTSGLLDDAPMFGSQDETALMQEVSGWKDDRFFTEAGKVYSYSNPGYWLAGRLAEQVGGKPFAEQVAATIFGPLGMARSTFRPMQAMTYPLAQGHDLVAGTPQIIRPAANNAASWPAGSIYSSVMDLSRWMMAFVNGGQLGGVQVLPASVFTTMATPRANLPGSTNKYGYGVQVGTWRGLEMVEHTGSRSGYGSVIRMVPSQKFGVVVLANRTGVSLTRTANAAIEAALTPAAAVAPSAPVVLPMKAGEAAAFVGVYSQGLRQVELVAKGDGLALKQADRETVLDRMGDLEFAAGTTRIVFVKNASGAVEYLHTGGRSWRRIR